MKKIILLSALLLALTCHNSFGQIFVNYVSAYSNARPFTGTWYLGDHIKQGSTDWFYNWEINYTDNWKLSEVGVGKEGSFPLSNTTWFTSDKYNSDGTNSLLHSDIGNYQFTSTGNYFVAGQAKGADVVLIYENGPWQNSAITLNPSTSSGYTAYFTVNALGNPASQMAGAASSTSIDLTWTKWNSKNVMVIRKLASTSSWAEPIQGTAYSVNDATGTGCTVIYNGSLSAFSDGSLDPNTTYDYKFYSENNSYYSDGVTASATTLPSAFAVTGSGSYCQGSGGLPVGVANSETGVTYELWKDGVVTGTTQPGSTGNAVSFGKKLAGTYTVKGTNAGGTTAMTGSAVITENALPLVPTVPDASIAICAGAYISATVGSGETADWYQDASGGTALATGTTSYSPAVAGTYYAEARNVASGCVSSTRTAVGVTQINPLPTAFISGSAEICEGISTNLTIALTGANPKNFTYTDGTTPVLINSIYGNSALISVTPASTKTYTITSVSDANCGGTYSGSAVITVNLKVTPTFTAVPTGFVCANTDVTYTTEAGQNNYVWTYPGATLGVDYSITTGGTSNDNTVTLQWKTSGSKSVGVNYTPTTGCASITPTIANTTVEPLSPTFTEKPGTSTCAGTNVIYTTQAGQSSYVWTYSGVLNTDYSITLGGTSGDNSVTLKWLTSGDKTVEVNYTPTSGCTLTGGSASTSVHVNLLPDLAGSIDGFHSVTKGQNGVTYSVGAITNATSYVWTYTGGGATIHGTGNSITIDFSYSSTSGSLTVQGLNDCGAGTASAAYSITVNAPLGPIAYAVTGTGSYCSFSGTGLAVGVANSETDVTYELFKDGITTNVTQTGLTGSSITFGLQLAGTYTVKGTKNSITTDMTGSAVITAVAPPTAYAGAPDFAMQNVAYLLSGATATNYTSVKWLLVVGNGSFSNDAILQPTFTGTVSSQTVTLQLTAKNGVCADVSSLLDLVIIPAGPYSKTWTGAGADVLWSNTENWDPTGSAPLQTDNVIIPTGLTKHPIINSTAICNNLTIQSGSVTVASGGSLTVVGTLTNSVGNAGLVVQSGGSLIEYSTGVAATVERSVSPGKWHFISPVNNNTNSGAFTGNFLQSWNEPTAAWSYITATNTTLNPVQGYSLWDKTGTTYSFTGALNTGNQSIGLTYHNTSNPNGNDGANFLGNPYPSSIDWAGLQGTYGAVYYWNGTGYVSYIHGNGGGSQFVPPMQGFFIVTGAPGTFALTNNNRVHSTTLFYKSGSEIKANTLVLATVGESYSDKLFVNFDPAATEGFDLQNDAYKFLGYTEGISELYSYAGDKKLSIDVRPETQVVQLGFTNTTSGEYQIGIDQVADIPLVYLEDTKTSAFHDLHTGPYTFSYIAGENDKRFILHFGTTGLKEAGKDVATIYSYQKTVYINMTDQTKGDIFIYNIAGQQVASKLSAKGMNEIRLANTGNYIVKVICRNNTEVRKVFIP